MFYPSSSSPYRSKLKVAKKITGGLLSQSEILSLASNFFDAAPSPKFIAEESAVPVSGKVLDGKDIAALVDASLDGWLTAGRFHDDFERALAKYVGVRNALFVNSGSSANLVALAGLTSPNLGKRALKPGDEVITVAAGFPTTVNPIIQNGMIPVFVDVGLGTYDAVIDQVRQAISPITRAIMMAHTLGNPFNVDAIKAI
jgi:CDP-6-deoxy-D-xylo-4-hexulose-3-dehydrase